jgi:hypothetical protein
LFMISLASSRAQVHFSMGRKLHASLSQISADGL